MFEHYYILYTKKEPKIDKTETSIKFSETRYRYGKIEKLFGIISAKQNL